MIRYTFEFGRQAKYSFDVDETGWTSAPAEAAGAVPRWAELERHRCDHCRLPAGMPACPAAMALRPVVEAFADRISYEEVLVRVASPERNHQELLVRTSLQEAVHSLVGLLMALSSCPVLMKLRPMAYFHLPFSSPEQTLFRVMGTYLLAQHLRKQQGLRGDWNLDGLAEIYEKILVINGRMADRIRLAAQEDAALNGLTILDAFAQGIRQEVQNRHKLRDWKRLFAAYL